MGLESLEEKYQEHSEEFPDKIEKLESLARKTSRIQKGMRAVLDGITDDICRKCETSCCSCMPVDGWFTETDYFIYRMLYDAPFDLRGHHDNSADCAFLSPDGCKLPIDMRPFPCVKVNCKWVTTGLEANGGIEEFNRLHDDLDSVQKQIWEVIKE